MSRADIYLRIRSNYVMQRFAESAKDFFRPDVLFLMALKVLTLNVWGLHYFAKRIRERLHYISEELEGYDIVGLQEVWSQDDYEFLVEQLRRVLPHSFRSKSGLIGSGLCVFSRYPIISVHSQQFTASGALRELTDGEVFAGKGILSCRIMTPGGPLLFVTTHTNGCCRESQIYEMTKLIDNYRGSDLVILCGDFNTGDSHPAYRLLTTYLGLKDAFAGCSVKTCNLASNIYTKRVGPARIDYIFYSSDTSPTTQMEVQSKRLALSGNIPGKDFPFSDHEGLEVVLALNERVEPMPPRSLHLSDAAVEVLEEMAQRICNRKMKYEASRPHRRAMAIAGGFLAIILLISLGFGNKPVMVFLGTYSLGYFFIVGVGILGVCLMWAWLIPVFNISHVNGMETHMEEIRVRVNYNRMLAESDAGNSYRLM